jgi:hypothetical protein
MFMHVVVGADISLECFARNLYNQGTTAVIHRQDKKSNHYVEDISEGRMS